MKWLVTTDETIPREFVIEADTVQGMVAHGRNYYESTTNR